jgi:hypothetical protein
MLPSPESPKNPAAASGRLPVFPTEALVGSLGELAKVLADGTEVPPEFIFAAALTIFGAMLSGCITLEIGLEVDTRLYTVLLGDSGNPKKSTALKKTRYFFDNLGSSKMPHVDQGVGSAEGLARVLAAHPDTLLAYDELRSLLDKAKAQASVLLPMIAALHEGHEWDNTVKTSQIHVVNARLSLIGCATEDTYEAMWDRQALAIGLPNRLFIVAASREHKIAFPMEPDAEKLRSIRARIAGQLADIGANASPRRFPIDEGAKRSFEKWYVALPGSSHATRLDTLGRTLMLLFAVTMNKEKIDVEVVERVLQVLEYELSVRIATDPIDADNVIAKLEEKIRRYLRTHPNSTLRNVRRGINADRDGLWAFERAIENLTNSKEICKINQNAVRLVDTP